jgi:hypothetical protein
MPWPPWPPNPSRLESGTSESHDHPQPVSSGPEPVAGHLAEHFNVHVPFALAAQAFLADDPFPQRV